MGKFHDKEVDAGTQLKLALFRGYIREWLPVFLTQYGGDRKNFQYVNIFDFFSGPGHDAKGNPGSPIIIVEELKQFCQSTPNLRANDIKIRMVFNDSDGANVQKLKEVTGVAANPQPLCQVEYSSKEFQNSLQQHLPSIVARKSANLIIMDQRGVKEVTPEVIRQLAECSATDILFFISSVIGISRKKSYFRAI